MFFESKKHRLAKLFFAHFLRAGFGESPRLRGRRAFGACRSAEFPLYRTRAVSLFCLVFNKSFFSVSCRGCFRIYSILFSQCFLASFVNAIMPKTLRAVTTASSTISRPPSGSTIPFSSSVSAPVIAIDSGVYRSPRFLIFPVCHSLLFSQSLSLLSLFYREGNPIAICLESFNLFVEWEKCSHPPSGAPSSLSSTTPVVVASSRPIYTLAPSALSCTSNPPRSDLGSTRPSTILASSRGQGAHVLPARGDAFPSQATRLHSSVARSGVVQSDNGDRSRASSF